MAPDPSLASCPCNSYLCFDKNILVKACLRCLWLCHSKWLFCPWCCSTGFLSECLCTHWHSWCWTLAVEFSAVPVRSLGDLVWWWQSRHCLVCLGLSLGGTSVLGLSLGSVLSVLSRVQNWHLHHPNCCLIGWFINMPVFISVSPCCVLAQ